MKKNMNLVSPWTNFYREIEALFKDDPEIVINYDEKNQIIRLLVDNEDKTAALSQLLPPSRTFGQVTVKVKVIPSNNFEEKSTLYERAFNGNPAFSFSETVQTGGPFSNEMNFVVFSPKVVQYYNDNIGDIHGLCSTLYEEIARDIFTEHDGVYFCTDKINME